MRILLLPGTLKGSLSALQAGQILTRHLTPRHQVRLFPISDGGDGFIDTWRKLDPASRLITVQANDAFLQPTRTSFLLLKDGKTAVIETARICGLGAAKKLDPLYATSYGVGEVILKAIKRGAKRIYVGLGGVACNDGGAGMAVACGALLADKQGRAIALGAKPLLQLARADFSALQQNIRGVQIIGCADVTNPLLGPQSSAKVFGPQKGATPAQVKLLDKAMARWAHVIKRATGRSVSATPSTAAAGAIGAGLAGCFGAKLLLGADFLMQKSALKKHIAWADLLLTSEGKWDAQTFCGKAPGGVLTLARRYQKPVLFICGQADWQALAKHHLPRVCVAQLMDFAPSLAQAKKYAGKYIARVCKNL